MAKRQAPQPTRARVKTGEARACFADLLSRAERGETIELARGDVVVALLGPASGIESRATAVTVQHVPSVAPAPSLEDGELARLRWLQSIAISDMQSAGDEKVRAVALKEARLITEKIGALTGELDRGESAGELQKIMADVERLPPSKLEERIVVLLETIRAHRKVLGV